MNMMDLATTLFGRSRAEENIVSTDATTRTYIGTATSDSSDGSVYVALSEDVTMPDDYDGEHGVGVEMPTTVGVSEGDDVVVTVFGGGTMKAPVVTGNPGWGDAVQEQVNNAETIAEQAEAVANATGQHFWPDSGGVHVTEVTQTEWGDSTSPNYHSGANVLLNALGQLFRDGLNNILAIVSGTDPGVAIYDGEGNTADNIMALFSKALIRIGGRLLGTGTSTATVQFFQSDASQTDIKATHTVGTTTPPTGPDDVYGVNHGVQVTTSTDDSELGAGAEGHAAWAALDLFADVNPDYETGQALLKATTGDTPYDSSTDPTLGVLRQVADNGIEASSIYGSAAEIQLNDTARYKTGVVTVEQAIDVLGGATFYQAHSNISITSTNTDITGPSITVPAGKYLILVNYQFSTASGSGTRTTVLGFKRTSGTASYSSAVQGARNYVKLVHLDLMSLTTSTTLTAYANASVTSGSNVCYINAIRIP